MAEQKLPNVFAEPGVEDFIRSACMTPLRGRRPRHRYSRAGMRRRGDRDLRRRRRRHRFSMMFNTYTMSDNSRYSPGLILMRNIIDHYAGLGYRALDLGIGSDDYKRLFCKGDEPIFDSFIPLSLRGKAGRGRDVGHQPRQASGEAQSGAVPHGAAIARRVSPLIGAAFDLRRPAAKLISKPPRRVRATAHWQLPATGRSAAFRRPLDPRSAK